MEHFLDLTSLTTTDPTTAVLLLALAGTGAAFTGWHATRVAPFQPVLRRLYLPVPDSWPRLQVLHLSDLHVRAGADRLYDAQTRFLQSVQRQPDLVCVTGDLCEQLGDVPRLVSLLQLVRPRLGMFVVLGNHEHAARAPDSVIRQHQGLWGRLASAATHLLGSCQRSSGAEEGHAISEALSRAGVPVLMNTGVRVTVDGQSLWIGGTDSVWAGCASPDEAFLGRRGGEPCLALVHEPEGAIPLIERGANLVLAGHTHGGQVALPVIGAPCTWRTDARIRVAAGVQQFAQGWLHVSAGLGHTTPLRFRCPPEATWLTCVPVDRKGELVEETLEALPVGLH